MAEQTHPLPRADNRRLRKKDRKAQEEVKIIVYTYIYISVLNRIIIKNIVCRTPLYITFSSHKSELINDACCFPHTYLFPYLQMLIANQKKKVKQVHAEQVLPSMLKQTVVSLLGSRRKRCIFIHSTPGKLVRYSPYCT